MLTFFSEHFVCFYFVFSSVLSLFLSERYLELKVSRKLSIIANGFNKAYMIDKLHELTGQLGGPT